jgi:hypothetical protein
VGEGYTVHWRVPIDDESHVCFDVFFNRVRVVERERYEQDFAAELVGDRYRRNKQNRYLQDRALMKTRSFTGMGDNYGVHDAFASESPGPIHDRSREHLGTTDVCIVAARRQLLAGIAAVEAGREPIHVIRDPAQNDMSHIVVVSEVIPPDVDHKDLWKRRAQKPHAAE